MSATDAGSSSAARFIDERRDDDLAIWIGLFIALASRSLLLGLVPGLPGANLSMLPSFKLELATLMLSAESEAVEFFLLVV